MKGRKTNQLLGVVNILVGILICIYVYIFKEYSVEFTRHHKLIFNTAKTGINVLVSLVVIYNLIFAIVNRKNKRLLVYYLLSLFTLMIFNEYSYVYSIFPILSGILLYIFMIKNNYIEKESSFSITISVLLILLTLGASSGIIMYNPIGEYMKNQERISLNLIKYDEEFFKYISPVEIEDKYINVKENGKWGFVNKEGEEIIPFDYDFATPFYKITAFDKEFEVAGVSKNKVTTIILKNKREVMSYNSEYESSDPKGKLEEFEEVLKTTLKQKEIILDNDSNFQSLLKKKVYNEDTENKNYTYRFEFSNKYDVLVIESQMGNKPKFKFASRQNTKDTIDINAENLLYDKTGLYVYKNGYLPFYSRSENIQGWFDEEGNRKKIEGSFQILDIDKDKILIKNYKKEVVYFIDYNMNEISQMYKEVIPFDNKYIVRYNDGDSKWTIIDNKLQKYVNEEWDIFTNRFLGEEIYLFANINENLEIDDNNYVKIDFALFKKDFTLFRSNTYREIYDLFYKVKNQEDSNEYYEFINSIKSGKIIYPGDQYYNKK